MYVIQTYIYIYIYIFWLLLLCILSSKLPSRSAPFLPGLLRSRHGPNGWSPGLVEALAAACEEYFAHKGSASSPKDRPLKDHSASVCILYIYIHICIYTVIKTAMQSERIIFLCIYTYIHICYITCIWRYVRIHVNVHWTTARKAVAKLIMYRLWNHMGCVGSHKAGLCCEI